MLFLNFCVLRLSFGNCLLLGLLKHYKKWGFRACLCFLLLKEKRENLITEIFSFGFLVQNGGFVTHNCFLWVAEPLFYSVMGCAFLGQVVKKGKFWTPPKNGLIIEKLFWGVFCVSFFCFSLVVVFFEGLRVR